MANRSSVMDLVVKATVAVLFSAVVAVGIAAPPQTVTLDAELTRVVGIIKRSLGDGNQLEIRPLTDLSANTRYSGAIGAGLREALVAECTRQAVGVIDGASHVITGQFHVVDPEGLRRGETLSLTLQLGLSDRRGRQPVELLPIYAKAGSEHFAKVTDLEFVAKAMGVVGAIPTVSTGPNDVSARDREKELARIVEKPSGSVVGTRIRCSPESEFEVEILSAPQKGVEPLRPLTPVIEGGLPFVDIPLDHKYQIQIYNHSKESLAVIASIDGLSVFHFADAQYVDPLTGRLTVKHYIIHPLSINGAERSGGVGIIPGWFHREHGPDNFADFVVSAYAQSAAAQSNLRPEGAGAIHLQFAPCRPKIKVRGNKGTGFGDLRTIPLTTSICEPGESIEFLTIRYDRSDDIDESNLR